VPYYRDLFDKLDLRPEDFKDISELKKLPVLSKREIRENPDRFLSSQYKKKKLAKNVTSGTTGAGMTFYRQPETVAFQWAIWWRFRKRFGVNLDDRHANFAGKPVVPINSRKPPFWRENSALNQTYFSSYHLTDENVKFYVNKLNNERYIYYSGYPSTLSILCQFIERQNLRIENPPSIVFTGSETLLPNQRDVISRVLNCMVADQYGAAEHICNISQCPDGFYHEDMELGIIEYLKPEYNNHNGAANIVATGLIDYAMPLIRYEIGDIAKFSDKPCQCGRKSKSILCIEGRTEDYIKTPDGRILGRLARLFSDCRNVYESQIVQDKIDHLTVFVVQTAEYGKTDEEEFRKKIINLTGCQFNIDFKYVNKIPREMNGKLRAVKSLL
jgi:phenylacetate-CoA ligase